MTRKLLKVLFGAIVVAVSMSVFAVMTPAPSAEADLPNYLGSTACLGCHVEKFESWEGTKHAHMLVQVNKPTDLPGDLNVTTPEVKAELLKADWIVAGKRFLARDPENGELKYLNVEWNGDTKKYTTYKGGSSWTTSCAGCHSTGFDKKSKTFASPGIGCESCHGPGKEHIKGKGDRSQIVKSPAPDVCAQCHFSSGTAKEDGGRWSQNFKPGMDAHDFINFPKVDPNGVVPTQSPKLRQYPFWEASGHANATNLLIARGPTYLARTECISCHSTSAGIDIKAGKKWDASTMLVNDGVSCVACHSSHESKYEGQLKMEAKALCESCHSIGRGKPDPVKIGTTRAPHSPNADMLWGKGALNVPDTSSSHSGLKCIDCHMTESNHLFKVIKPEDVAGTTRKDSCSSCHTKSNSESRGLYLAMWQDNISGRLATVKTIVTAMEERLKANPEALTKEQKTAFEQWRANFWYVEKDKSKGAHNFEYAMKILSQSEKELLKLKDAMK